MKTFLKQRDYRVDFKKKKKNGPAITGPTGTKLYSPPVLRISLKWAPTPSVLEGVSKSGAGYRRAWEPG